MQLARYLKSAFLYHWNLLAFLGGASFAVLSGQPDVFGPLVLAAEVAYLGFLGSHPKFQKYVDAQKNQAARQQASAGAENTMQRIVRGLPEKQAQRFKRSATGASNSGRSPTISRSQARPASPTWKISNWQGSIDCCGFTFACSTHKPCSNASSTRRTKPGSAPTSRTSKSGWAARPNRTTTHQSRSSARPFRTTSRPAASVWPTSRKPGITASWSRPRSTTSKTRSAPLSELAVNRQDPDFILGQVDLVASSMVQTERTMNELRFATGLDAGDESVPAILRKDRPANGGHDEASSLTRRREQQDDIQFL